MTAGTEIYRRKWGVSPVQRHILIRMKETGEISYGEAGGNGGVQQLHRLTGKGLLEFVGGEPYAGRWRLTERGRLLVDSWS